MTSHRSTFSQIALCLRAAGIVALLIIVLKSFLLSEIAPSRQATIRVKGVYEPMSDPTSHSNGLMMKVNFESNDPPFRHKQTDIGVDGEFEACGDLSEGKIENDTETDLLLSHNGDLSPPVTLHLIGERHSGTKWMSSHLESCFSGANFTNKPFRWKHWFQDESIERPRFQPNEKFVVVALFRNPYSWTEAMRSYPHHSPDHFDLEWLDFVTRKWDMPRYSSDLEFIGWTAEDSRRSNASRCAISKYYFPHQVIPCNADRIVYSTQGVQVDALYELRNDGSGKPYNNVLEMRKDKIKNHIGVADFDRVQDVFVVRYGDAKLHGTNKLIRQLEKALGQDAVCEPLVGDPEFRERPIPKPMFEYLRLHVDWETEAMIGYLP